MKKQIFVLTLCSIFFLQSAQLFSAAAPQPTQLSKEVIAQKIETIHKTVDGLNQFKAGLIALEIGVDVSVIVLDIAISIGISLILPEIAPGLFGVKVAGAVAKGAGVAVKGAQVAAKGAQIGSNLLQRLAARGVEFAAQIGASVALQQSVALAQQLTPKEKLQVGAAALLIEGTLGKLGLIFIGNLSPEIVIAAVENMVDLEEQEERIPGSLTPDQIKKIIKFKKLLNSPLGQGVVMGILLKKAKQEVTDRALAQHKETLTALGDAKQAAKWIRSYIELVRDILNHEEALAVYVQSIEENQKKIESLKKLDPKRVVLGAKVLDLKIKKTFLGEKIRAHKKKLAKLVQGKDKEIKVLEAFAQEYVKEAARLLMMVLG